MNILCYCLFLTSTIHSGTLFAIGFLSGPQLPDTDSKSEYHEVWLGPQTRGKGVRESIRTRVLSTVEVKLVSQFGEDISLPDTVNKITIIKDGKLNESTSVNLERNKRYLVATINGVAGKNPGWMIYELDVEVVGGPLAGAIVHCRSGRILEDYSAPMIAVFEVPLSIAIDDGELEFKIVHVKFK